MATRITAYEDALRRSDAGEKTVLDILLGIFRDLDARTAGVEDRAASLAEFEATLRTYGEDLILQQLAPLRAAMEETADLGAVFTARSVTAVAIGTGTRTFEVLAEDRATFAPAHMLAITATDDPSVVLWGRKLAWVKETGALTVDVLSATGAGTVTSWTIGPGVAAPFAAAVPMLAVDGIPAATVQAAMTVIAAALAARTTTDELDDLLAAKADATAVTNALALKADAATTTAALAAKAPLVSPALTGTPTAPTADPASDGTQIATTAFARAAVAAAPYPVRWGNLVINGDVRVGARAAVITGTGFVVDRWRVSKYSPGTRTVQRLADPGVPGGQMIEYTFAGLSGSYRYEILEQRIEGPERYVGLPLVITFEGKVASGTKTIRADLFRYFGTGGSPFQHLGGSTTPLTTEWAAFTIPVAADAAAGKSFGSTETSYLRLRFLMGHGGGPGMESWDAGVGSAAATVHVRRVRVLVGTVGAPFEPRPPAVEEALCRRYYQRIGRGLVAVAKSASSVLAGGQLPVRMRTTPTLALLDTAPVATFHDAARTAAGAAASDLAVAADGVSLSLSGFTGLAAGQAGIITSGDLVALDAEL